MAHKSKIIVVGGSDSDVRAKYPNHIVVSVDRFNDKYPSIGWIDVLLCDPGNLLVIHSENRDNLQRLTHFGYVATKFEFEYM